jgi:FdhE protein
LPRILEPGQIEAQASRSVPQIRSADRQQVFANRARRLRQLAEQHPLGEYLRLIGALADAQQEALRRSEALAPAPQHLQRALAHQLPLLPAQGGERGVAWREVLGQLCREILAQPQFPPGVTATCQRLRQTSAEHLEAQADALLAQRSAGIDEASAPFIMAALQVWWVDLASRLARDALIIPDAPGLCPFCGTAPVSSIVRVGAPYDGYRYLHCGLCATEWHMVRIKCSQCAATQGISYHSVDGKSTAVRAESCERCRTYRKILYQEHDPGVEPVADDLASLTLDLLLTEAHYHRASGNPMLWQRAGE